MKKGNFWLKFNNPENIKQAEFDKDSLLKNRYKPDIIRYLRETTYKL